MPTDPIAYRETLLQRLHTTVDFAARQTRRLIDRYPGYYPMYTVDGQWKREGELWTHWCEGFLPGLLWLFHKQTGETAWRSLAEEYSKPLEPRRLDRTVHDLG